MHKVLTITKKWLIFKKYKIAFFTPKSQKMAKKLYWKWFGPLLGTHHSWSHLCIPWYIFGHRRKCPSNLTLWDQVTRETSPLVFFDIAFLLDNLARNVRKRSKFEIVLKFIDDVDLFDTFLHLLMAEKVQREGKIQICSYHRIVKKTRLLSLGRKKRHILNLCTKKWRSVKHENRCFFLGELSVFVHNNLGRDRSTFWKGSFPLRYIPQSTTQGPKFGPNLVQIFWKTCSSERAETSSDEMFQIFFGLRLFELLRCVFRCDVF